MADSTVTLKACSVCCKEFMDNELIAYGNDNVCSSCKGIYFQRVREGLPGTQVCDLNYASIGMRFLASIIDGIITSGVQTIFNFILIGSYTYKAGANVNLGAFGLTMVVSIVFGVLYYVLFLGWKGATPGKMILGLKVVAPDGSAIGYGRAVLRYIGTFVSGITLGIGYLIAFWDAEKKALHDRIASTRVISTR